MKNQVAIIGHGFVGNGMNKIFPDALIFEKDMGQEQKDLINKECGLAIVCVPTPPMGMEGEQKVNEDEEKYLGVDLSIIEDTIAWLDKDILILIKSTIPPGTTDKLREKHGKRICFSPEYMGEGNYYTPPKYPDPLNPLKHDFMIVGGDKKDCDGILAYFIRKMGPAKKYYIIDAVEAECVKYMENTWGAMKVTFCQEWYEICEKFGASYNRVREGLLLDARTESMHTAVFPDKRGFGGKCYPKDLMGIIAQAEEAGYSADMLKEVWESNKRMLKRNK